MIKMIMTVILGFIIIGILYSILFEFFVDRREYETIEGTVSAKDRTYDKHLESYKYATRVYFEDDYYHTFKDYDTYMNLRVGQKVVCNVEICYGKNDRILRTTYMECIPKQKRA